MDFDELRKLAKTSLSAYASIMHHDWNPNWHHRVIARMLERFANNEPGWGKVILSLPPRSGKTELVSKLFPGWFMANHPHENVIVATYGGELSDDLGRKAREYASTELFESVMGCRISADTNAITKWELDNRASFFATSVGGALTGKGAHCLIVDDPVRSREDADSESARQKTWDWFTSTAYTRLEKGGRVLIVMTRWSSDDLAGRLLESNTGWREVKFPAIAEEDDEFRKAGDPLWPDKYPLEKLHEIRAQIGMRDWASLYQQRPAPQDGDIFRAEWMKTYPSLDHLERTGVVFEAVYQSWDTAVSGKSSSARSACTTWGVSGGKYYLLHTYAEPLSFPELRAKALELAQQWEPDMIYIEEQQTGRPLIDELKRHLGNRMTAIRPKGTKEARARAASVLFETGKVYLPEDAPWLASYVQELLGFPAGKFMDRVDSTSLILNALMKQYRNGGGVYVADNPYQGFGRQKMPNIYSR